MQGLTWLDTGQESQEMALFWPETRSKSLKTKTVTEADSNWFPKLAASPRLNWLIPLPQATTAAAAWKCGILSRHKVWVRAGPRSPLIQWAALHGLHGPGPVRPKPPGNDVRSFAGTTASLHGSFLQHDWCHTWHHKPPDDQHRPNVP